ncbi:MAG: 50S ribosomal protein L5 [Lentisphaerae bacterium GWF2_52_8]|nr:MAG: 50S ribosomal protein L5 [Lentisphaerae bacterium GWF2_52_8]
MPDMMKQYKEQVAPALLKKRGYKNVMEVPKLKKIVLSTGINTSAERDVFNEAKLHFTAISGQLPVITKSTKNIANFKLRKGQPVGLMVTMRGARMYEFLDRLIHITLPRVRDFRGIPKKGFDGAGNYNFGVPDITVFTEIDLDKVKHPMGLNITMVTSAKNKEEAFDLLALLDLPFAQ